jgi:putative transposase
MAYSTEGHVGLHFIPPGQPWRNGYVESFSSRIRDECLTSTASDYNHHHRHSALGYQPPARYAASCTHR